MTDDLVARVAAAMRKHLDDDVEQDEVALRAALDECDAVIEQDWQEIDADFSKVPSDLVIVWLPGKDKVDVALPRPGGPVPFWEFRYGAKGIWHGDLMKAGAMMRLLPARPGSKP